MGIARSRRGLQRLSPLKAQMSFLYPLGVTMLLIVDEREIVREAYRTSFLDSGVSVACFGPSEMFEWFATSADSDMQSVEAIVVGAVPHREALLRAIRSRCIAPIVMLIETPSLEHTLSLFAAGADDVVRKPVHARELLARIATIKRRIGAFAVPVESRSGLVVFFDGRDPEIDGIPFTLPRRERRILEFLVSHAGKRVTKTQIFNAIYGLFDEEVDECVVESHISKLRKKLRARLGYDPVDAKRYLGYQFSKTSINVQSSGVSTSASREDMVAA